MPARALLLALVACLLVQASTAPAPRADGLDNLARDAWARQRAVLVAAVGVAP